MPKTATKSTTKTTKPVSQPLLVTTLHKGVFFGYGDRDSVKDGKIRLTNCRMCIYWDIQVKGVLGLAVDGPNKQCKITKATLETDLTDVTAVSVCTPEAAANWEKGYFA